MTDRLPHIARDRLDPAFVALVVVEAEGCWVWQGGTNGRGYGKFRRQYAHRVAYEAIVGPIPVGLELDHLCRRHPCVNPAHLEPVTHRVNTLRGDTIPASRARQTHCIAGHPLAGPNLKIQGDGTRTCRRCRADRMARYRAKAAA